jgi:hypothetical protein
MAKRRRLKGTVPSPRWIDEVRQGAMSVRSSWRTAWVCPSELKRGLLVGRKCAEKGRSTLSMAGEWRRIIGKRRMAECEALGFNNA